MGKIFRICLIVAGGALLSGGFASAYADECRFFGVAAVNFSQKMRAVAQRAPGGRCPGHNLLDPFWSTNSIRQLQWCASVPDETVRIRTQEMYRAIEICSYCTTYANIVTSAANDNIKYGCGFKNDGDQRWLPDLNYHFVGCAAVKDCSDDVCISDTSADWIRSKLEPIASQVTLAVAECKLEKGIGTASSALTVPRAIPPRRDSVGRVKHGGNTSIKSHNDLAAPARPSNQRETAVTAKHDHTPPPERARSRPPHPCKSATATKPCSVGASKNTSNNDTIRAANPCQPGRVTDPCKSKSRVVSPGLLDGGGGGFGVQTPSATGTPLGGGGSRGGTPLLR
jgi:hypothetical protein